LTSRILERAASTFSPKEREGATDGTGLRIAVLCARWNPTVTEAMLREALAALERAGVREADVTVVRVPGAFELSSAARALSDSGRFDAVVALAAIVRGETTHHEVLGHAVGGALAQLTAANGMPIGFGVLTCDTMEQARARVSKGCEAAEAAVEMANLRRALREG
jgi:6,7-dimethyl-8-ribityllumazine synthase